MGRYMKNNFKSGLQKALDELENITPLKPFNCGKLCSARCCCGGDNDGMGLFPGEKVCHCTDSRRPCVRGAVTAKP